MNVQGSSGRGGEHGSRPLKYFSLNTSKHPGHHTSLYEVGLSLNILKRVLDQPEVWPSTTQPAVQAQLPNVHLTKAKSRSRDCQKVLGNTLNRTGSSRKTDKSKTVFTGIYFHKFILQSTQVHHNHPHPQAETQSGDLCWECVPQPIPSAGR